MSDIVTLEKTSATLAVPAPEQTPVAEQQGTTPADEASATPDDNKTTEEPASEADQPRGVDGRFVKRTEKLQSQINQLTAEKRQAEREVARLRDEAIALAKQLKEPPQIDPADFDAQTAHRVRSEIKADRLDQTANRIKDAEASAREKDEQIFALQVSELRGQIPDIDSVYLPPSQGGPQVTPAMGQALLRAENGALVAYHLKQKPQEALRIAALDPWSQAVEIGKLSTQVANPKPIKRISQAPAPVQTVSGSTAQAGVDLSNVDYETYRKARMAQGR